MLLATKAGRRMLVACSLLGLLVAGCSSSDEQRDADGATTSRAERYPGIRHFPRELRKVIRHDDRALSETLAAIPTMFILSYSCASDGRKALTVTGYPRSATSHIKIRANGRTAARGTVYPGSVLGSFLDADGSQTVVARQATSAQIQDVQVEVRFDTQGQCRVDDLTMKMHRKS